jgi:hypothetical protein
VVRGPPAPFPSANRASLSVFLSLAVPRFQAETRVVACRGECLRFARGSSVTEATEQHAIEEGQD